MASFCNQYPGNQAKRIWAIHTHTHIHIYIYTHTHTHTLHCYFRLMEKVPQLYTLLRPSLLLQLESIFDWQIFSTTTVHTSIGSSQTTRIPYLHRWWRWAGQWEMICPWCWHQKYWPLNWCWSSCPDSVHLSGRENKKQVSTLVPEDLSLVLTSEVVITEQMLVFMSRFCTLSGKQNNSS